MTVLTVPARIRGMGRFHLGQEGVYDPRVTVWAQPKAPKPDMSTVLTADEVSAIVFDNADEAFNYYRYLVLTVAIQTKMAFITDLWKTVKSRPELVGALAATEGGRMWLEAFKNSEAAFLSFTQPNYFQNLQRVRNHMEVNILPKKYGIGVRGRLPMFVLGSTSLSYSDVIIAGSAVKTTYEFGDLQTSTLQSDIKNADELADLFKVKPQLGLTTVAIAIIAVAAVIISGFLYAGWIDYLDSKKIPPEVLKAIEKVDPKDLERVLEKWGKVGGMFSGLSDTLMWGAVGLGIIVVGGTILYVATK